jgi:hypothetical protein
MTTVAEQAELIKRRLLATARGRYNFLATPVAPTDTSFAFEDDLAGIVVGNLIGVEDEICYVRAVAGPNRILTVQRGWLGTTAVAHGAEVAVELAPRFPSADIVDTMAEEILSWSPQLFVAQAVDIPVTYGTKTYDAGTNGTEVLSGLDLTHLTTRYSGLTSDGSRARPAYRLLRNQDPALYPSTIALELEDDPAYVGPMRFVYGTEYLVDLVAWGPATDLSALGVLNDQLDVLRYGVMWRMMSSREIGRADLHSFGESRKAEEVPAGLQLNVTKTLLTLHDRCMADAGNSLRDRYPYRRG